MVVRNLGELSTDMFACVLCSARSFFCWDSFACKNFNKTLMSTKSRSNRSNCAKDFPLPSQETLESSMFWCFSWAKVWRPWQLGLGKPRVKQSSRCDVKGFVFDAFWKDVFEIILLDVSGV